MGEKNTIIFGRKEETVFFIFGLKEDVGKKRKVIFEQKEFRPFYLSQFTSQVIEPKISPMKYLYY
jgi:hypothetical protein